MARALGDQLCYEFEGFRLDVGRRVIEAPSSGRTLSLEPRVFAAALYLVQHAGCVLSKERLLAALWPDSIVEENSLAQVISILRRILGEARGENRYIVTVPRRGYCFVADVNAVGDVVEARSTQTCGVAVDAFEVWSALGDDTQFAVGIAESTRHCLARTPGVRVVSPAAYTDRTERSAGDQARPPRSALQYHVQGRLQRAGLRLRITARLVDACDGTHLWSMLTDCTGEDVFLVEDEVSHRVAGALRQVLAPGSRSRAPGIDGEAYPVADRGQSSATG